MATAAEGELRQEMPDLPALPPVIGHRGAAASAPENTLAGFQRACALGCRWVEFDVRLTGDGVPIVMHDPRLERTTTGRGKLAHLPFATIRQHDAGGWFGKAFSGERVPTLDEALTFAAELRLGVNIELKAENGRAAATAAATAAVLARYVSDEAPPVLLSSFLPDAVAAARDLAPAIPRGILFRAIPRGWRHIAESLGCATIHADHQRLHPALVAAIRAAGYPLLAYTVNDPARARALFGWGVTSVISDAPDIILAAIGKGGNKLADERQGTVW